MTTEYPGGTTPTGRGDPNYLPPARDAASGCAWWWWLLIIIIIILIIWWAGWGWGTSGGYWFHGQRGTGNGTVAPVNSHGSGVNGVGTMPRRTGPAASEPASQPGVILPSGLLLRL